MAATDVSGAVNLLRHWLGGGADRSASPAPPPDPRPPGDELAGLRAALAAVVSQVRAESGRLPTGAIPEVRETADQIVELLDYCEATARAGDTVEPFAMFTLSAAITDYLPTSIDGYLALPPAFLANHRSPTAQSPAEELVAQLVVLRRGMVELAASVYAGDSQRLTSQRRFLETKFSGSDLDL